MVGHASDAVKVAILIFNESKHVGVKLALVILHYGGDAAMGAEDNMIRCLCVAHGYLFFEK